MLKADLLLDMKEVILASIRIIMVHLWNHPSQEVGFIREVSVLLFLIIIVFVEDTLVNSTCAVLVDRTVVVKTIKTRDLVQTSNIFQEKVEVGVKVDEAMNQEPMVT